MADPRIARFYLDDGLRRSAAEGRHNFLGKLATVLDAAGYRVEYRPDTLAERLKSETRRGFAVFHMKPPTTARGVTVRRVYHYPFWAIEPSHERWDWKVARTPFDPSAVPRAAADRFYGFWQHRLFGDDPAQAQRDGSVYVPLQGRVRVQRSFQRCAPVEMLQKICEAAGNRPVVATLHPNETYDAGDHSALRQLQTRFPALSVDTGNMDRYLRACSVVITQNSSAAFNGYFFGKPAILYGKSDFHHIAAVPGSDLMPDLDAADAAKVDYAGYLHWFWQKMSINAGRPEADGQIVAALKRAGWPMT